MDAVKNDVKRLVKIELAAANKKFRMFAGPHEGAGIIQEEVVEAVKEMNGLRQELNAMWMNVYSNNPQMRSPRPDLRRNEGTVPGRTGMACYSPRPGMA